jgi:hypothetical protein
VGGLGICGRPFCCVSFLDDFQPVSIKMAKTQNLSLNPTKISGTCGRLMCCLKYEQDAYEDLLRRIPKEESFVDTPEGRGTVIEVNLLRQQVKVRMEDAPETVSVFSNEDIAVLRNGKAKKNDPPIPADLAPISGAGKRVRKEREKDEEAAFLDPIKFRYREDAVVEETPDEPEQSGEEVGESRQNRRRRNNRKPRAEVKPAQEETAPVEVQEAPAEQGEKSKKPNNRRRYHYHRRKPKSGGEQN